MRGCATRVPAEGNPGLCCRSAGETLRFSAWQLQPRITHQTSRLRTTLSLQYAISNNDGAACGAEAVVESIAGLCAGSCLAKPALCSSMVVRSARSPDHAHPVAAKRRIGAQDRQALSHRLGNQHPVKRVAVVWRQPVG